MAKNPKTQVITPQWLKDLMQIEADKRNVALSTYIAHVLEVHHTINLVLITSPKDLRKLKALIKNGQELGGQLAMD